MSETSYEAALSPDPAGVQVRIKVVPGSSRDRIAGLLGDRVKLAVRAPAEGGKANRAVTQFFAATVGVAARDVTLLSGSSQPQKVLRIAGRTTPQVAAALAAQDRR